MRVLITGAAGLVASHFARRLAREHEVLALTHRELDIADGESVHRRVADFHPDLIINGAAIQVDEAEERPATARAVNADGPRILAQAANWVGAEMIHFGTQYAFEGEPVGRSPYTIADEARPVNYYGRSKLAGEDGVLNACARSFIIRTAWVYGRGKNSFLCNVHEDLRTGKRVRAIDDIWSSTTYVEDLIDRCLEILRRRRYGTYHVVNDGVCTYHEFAIEAGDLVALSRGQIDALIEITHERDMKRAAARPRYTPLRCLVSEELALPPMRGWREALAAYVGAQKE
jgi:dTDP-4-dehydrorhamnose reductase